MINDKVLFISTVHTYPDPRIISKELYSLKKMPLKLFYLGQHKSPNEIKENGITIIPLKMVKSRKERIFLQYDVYKYIKKLKPGIIHFHDPELILLMFFVKKFFKIKVIFDVHESIAESFVSKEWLPVYFRKILPNVYSFFEKILIKDFDSIIVVKSSFLKIYSADSIIIRNYPKVYNNYQKCVDKKYNERINIVYAGVIAVDRGIFIILDLIKDLSNKYKNIELHLIGKFDNNKLECEVKDFVRKENLGGIITIYGYLPIEDVYNILNNVHLGLSLMEPTPSYKNAISTKIFDYMIHGVCYLVSDFDIYNKYTKEYDTGVMVPYDDYEKIYSTICYLLENRTILQTKGINGYNAVKDYWNWSTEEKKLLDLYKKLV